MDPNKVSEEEVPKASASFEIPIVVQSVVVIGLKSVWVL